MSDRADHDEDQSRKRPWLEQLNEDKEEVTPTKRTKGNEKKGFGGFFFTPFNSLYGMIYGDDKKKKKKERKIIIVEEELADENEEEEVVVERISPKRQENSTGPIIFLNDDRQRAGSEEVIIEKHVRKDVVVTDDEKQEEKMIPVTSSHLEKSFEAQDDEPDVVFENVVITPNRQLQAARRFETELIYLNDNAPPEYEISVISDNRSQDFVSPTPDDSVSRPRTPADFASFGSSNNVRDYWRRSTAKKPSVIAKRQPVRQQFKYTSSMHKTASSGIHKFQKARQLLSSRDRLLQGIVASGQYDARAIAGIAEIPDIGKISKKSLSTSEVIARTRNKIAEINASRSNTPSISRESSVVFDGTSQRSHHTPSSSSEVSFPSNRLTDMLSQITSLGINSTYRGHQRYEKAYEQTMKKESTLLEEARIREEYRAQTKGDQLEDVRKRLELQGISIRPKPPKAVQDFVELPKAADLLIEKAWNKGFSGTEQFVERFGIPIMRKDLATLSGLHWLNDNIINFYLQLICDRSTLDTKFPKCYAFNTFFYTNIVTKGYASVKRWTRKLDIFSYEIILIPVHLGMHWCMAVIDMVKQKIEFYDSLYDGNKEVLPALKNYLASESMDKKKTEFNFDGWMIRQMTNIPRQENGSDCGVFSCQFGEWASRRTAPRFSQKNMPYYRKRMVYEIVSEKLLATI
uniref:ULP_PROTEASE domain-containing protein n=1 Tax=Caenorhabditis tropicalis TaxID=1561998 RepID=A0A1I7TWM6_9PELO